MSYKHLKIEQGFTLLELVIVIAIMTLAAGIIIWSLAAFQSRQTAANAAAEIISALTLARAQTLNGLADQVHGIHFTANNFTAFVGSSFNNNDSNNKTTSFNGVTLNLNLVGGGSDIIFDRLTGGTSDTGVITVNSGNVVKTITILSSGLITLD